MSEDRKLIDGHLDRSVWRPGERAWFEYHCCCEHDSQDAHLWYRTHREVRIIEVNADSDGLGLLEDGFRLRCDEGLLVTYTIEFEDGHQACAVEDELMLSPVFLDPNWGPPPREEIVKAVADRKARYSAIRPEDGKIPVRFGPFAPGTETAEVETWLNTPLLQA